MSPRIGNFIYQEFDFLTIHIGQTAVFVKIRSNSIPNDHQICCLRGFVYEIFIGNSCDCQLHSVVYL